MGTSTIASTMSSTISSTTNVTSDVTSTATTLTSAMSSLVSSSISSTSLSSTTASGTGGCNTTDPSPQMAVFISLWYSLVFLFGLIGNALVILVLIKYKRLRIMTNIFLFNLALGDLLLIFTLPFWIHFHSGGTGGWDADHHMCKFIVGLCNVALYSEVLFIILLTLDRYLAVVYAVAYRLVRVVPIGILASLLAWILAVLGTMPEFIFYESNNATGKGVCQASYTDFWKGVDVTSMTMVTLILPLLIMAFCYWKIIKVLLKAHNRSRNLHAVKLILIMVVLYFVFWIPYNVLLILHTYQEAIFGPDCEARRRVDMALLVAEMIACTHCCVNPVIYAFVGEKFQQNLQDLTRQVRGSLHRVLRSSEPKTPTGSRRRQLEEETRL
ncbi:G protein-coupled receptor [Equid gammaherpesvirus 5]|uniref:Membrane protein E1 n=1 Tax=Equid gammaherpesvirus 5 TaxID=10371 RepID=A0A0B4Q5M2_9GAMA|nr:membrane protein E1 [Equid gammaherpesvirus 5]AIU39528.1 membrane protein E1 [Equid gammaherpesvirus 5]APT43394.1 G protein-coupled receptor [Equid gammaherpesvirus 5]